MGHLKASPELSPVDEASLIPITTPHLHASYRAEQLCGGFSESRSPEARRGGLSPILQTVGPPGASRSGMYKMARAGSSRAQAKSRLALRNVVRSSPQAFKAGRHP